jgi:universal stress protein A
MDTKISSILVATDFSDSSDGALAHAATLAASLNVPIHLIHVLEEPFVTSGPYEFMLPDTPDRRERRYQLAHARLAEMRRPLEHAGIRTTIEVRSGTPTEGITSAAVDYGADLIVMGTHGRSGLQHLLLGSVAERVIRTARCAVLTVRAAPKSGHLLRPETAAEWVA